MPCLCYAHLQGVAAMCSLLQPLGLTRAAASVLITLAEGMGAAFEPPLAEALNRLVR
jgi:hypothetical protein